MNKWNIEYKNWGIGNRFPNYRIELHKKLKTPRYLQLHDEILKHEKSHTDSGYSIKDLGLDCWWVKNSGRYWEFILTTPSSWVQFLPVYSSKGKWYLDINVSLLWLGLLLFFSIFIFILKKYFFI